MKYFDIFTTDKILENFPDPYIVLQYCAGEGALVLKQVNQRFEVIFSRSIQTLYGRVIDDVMPSLAVDSNFDRYRETACEGGSFQLNDFVYNDENIHIRFTILMFQTAPNHVMVLFRDVVQQAAVANTDQELNNIESSTRLDRIIQKLRQTEYELSEAMGLAQAGTWQWGVDSDSWVVSEQWKSLYGVEVAPRDLKTFLSYTHPDDTEKVTRVFEEFKVGVPIRNLEYRIIQRTTDALRVVKFRGDWVKTHVVGGQKARGIAQDITDTYMKEKQLCEVNESLKQFAYVVSHDLRAPLRGIRLAIHWLRSELKEPLSDGVKENLGFLESRSERLTKMIDGVLRYSLAERSESTELEFSAREALDKVLDDLEVSSEYFKVNGSWSNIYGDITQFTQVLQNLISNAIRFNDSSKPQVVLSMEKLSRCHRIWIEDNGPGIDIRHRERVFQLFSILHSRDVLESTGVGLTICKRLVERWGGQIGIDKSTLGGASVWFTVPFKHHH